MWSNFKDISQISLILRGFDRYLPLYPLVRELIFKLVSLDFIHVYSMTIRIRFIIYFIEGNEKF